MKPARLFAYLSYRNAPAALAWLEAVGFTAVRRQDGPDGSVIHAEVRLDEAALMLSSADADYLRPPLASVSTGTGLYLRVEDVQGLYDRALAAGGQSVIAPESTPWGSIRARVLDPEGTEFTFGTYEPGTS